MVQRMVSFWNGYTIQEGTESIHLAGLLCHQNFLTCFIKAHVFLNCFGLGGSGVRVITLAVISCFDIDESILNLSPVSIAPPRCEVCIKVPLIPRSLGSLD